VEKQAFGEITWPVSKRVQMNLMFTDSLLILCSCCNIKKSKTTACLDNIDIEPQIYLMRNEVSHTYSFCFCISQYKRIISNLLPMKCFPSFMSSRLHSSEFGNLLYPYCYGHSLVALFTKTTVITYRLFHFLIQAQYRTKFIFCLIII